MIVTDVFGLVVTIVPNVPVVYRRAAGRVSRGVTATLLRFRSSSNTGQTAPASSFTWTPNTYVPKSSGRVVQLFPESPGAR